MRMRVAVVGAWCVLACRGAGNAARHSLTLGLARSIREPRLRGGYATSPARGGGRLAASAPRSAITRLRSGSRPSPCIPPPQAGSAKGGGIPRPAHSVSAEPGCGRRIGAPPAPADSCGASRPHAARSAVARLGRNTSLRRIGGISLASVRVSRRHRLRLVPPPLQPLRSFMALRREVCCICACRSVTAPYEDHWGQTPQTVHFSTVSRGLSPRFGSIFAWHSSVASYEYCDTELSSRGITAQLRDNALTLLIVRCAGRAPQRRTCATSAPADARRERGRSALGRRDARIAAQGRQAATGGIPTEPDAAHGRMRRALYAARASGGGVTAARKRPRARANRGGERPRSRAPSAQRRGPRSDRTRTQSGDCGAVRAGSGTPSARGEARLGRSPPHADWHRTQAHTAPHVRNSPTYYQ